METLDLRQLELMPLSLAEQAEIVGGYSFAYHLGHAIGRTMGQVVGGCLTAISLRARDLLTGH